MFSNLLLGGAKFFESFPVLGNMIRFFYLKFLLPFYFKKIQIETGVTFQVKYRHSVLNKNFNPCLSDIDYSLVFKDITSSELDLVLQKLLNPKLKILDIPQVYLFDEWDALPDIDDIKNDGIRFFWYFRKKAWTATPPVNNAYEQFKKILSHKRIDEEVFVKDQKSIVFNASALNFPFPKEIEMTMCLYSPYLELRGGTRVFECGPKQFSFIQSILPGEKCSDRLSKETIQFKKSLWMFEYLLSRSHYRVHSRMGEDCSSWLPVLRELENNFFDIFKEELPKSGKDYDFYP